MTYCDSEGHGAADPAFNLDELRLALAALPLNSVSLGKYVVVMNSEFDVTVNEEPYLALTVVLDTRSGKFMSRIWSQTVKTGRLGNVGEFVELCKMHFDQGPCMGFICSADEQSSHKYLTSQTPVPRKIAADCRKVVGKAAVVATGVSSCPACLELEDLLLEKRWKEEEEEAERSLAEAEEHRKCMMETQNISAEDQNHSGTASVVLEDKDITEEDIMGQNDEDILSSSSLMEMEKRGRLKKEQRAILLSCFAKNNDPDEEELKDISDKIGHSVSLVSKWFVRRRRYLKQRWCKEQGKKIKVESAGKYRAKRGTNQAKMST